MRSGTKKSRCLAFEVLDRREFMAADVTASVSNGVLRIAGTVGNDTVLVDALPDGTTRILSGRGLAGDPLRQIFRGATASYASISAQLGSGYDKLTVNLPKKSISALRVDFGLGNAEELFVRSAPRIGLIDVNAKDAIGTKVNLRDTVVDNLIANYGTDTGSDHFEATASTIGKLTAWMGAGNDSLILYRSTTIRSANVAMGDGMDNVSSPVGVSAILSGVVDGGAGVDRVSRGTVGGALVRSFERTV